MIKENRKIECGDKAKIFIDLMSQIAHTMNYVKSYHDQDSLYMIGSDDNPEHYFKNLSQLIHVICNNPELYKHTSLKKEDYTFDFPLFSLKDHKADSCKMHEENIEYSFFEKDGYSYVTEYVKTPDYTIYNEEDGRVLVHITSDQMKEKTDEEVIKIVMADMQENNRRMKASPIYFIYQLLNIIDDNNTIFHDDQLAKLTKFLSDKQDLLKLITILSSPSLQERMLQNLINVSIKVEDPVNLLESLRDSLTLLNKKRIPSKKVRDEAIWNLDNHIKMLHKEKSSLTLYKYILKESLESDLKNNAEHKRMKI